MCCRRQPQLRYARRSARGLGRSSNSIRGWPRRLRRRPRARISGMPLRKCLVVVRDQRLEKTAARLDRARIALAIRSSSARRRAARSGRLVEQAGGVSWRIIAGCRRHSQPRSRQEARPDLVGDRPRSSASIAVISARSCSVSRRADREKILPDGGQAPAARGSRRIASVISDGAAIGHSSGTI